MKINYIGKCLFIENKEEDVLVIGDLHLGYEEIMRSSGVLVPSGIYEEIIEDMERVIELIRDKQKKVNKIILLGDLRHEFGRILRTEWKEVMDFIDYLKEKLGSKVEIIIVKGNHDTMTSSIVKKKGLEIVDYYLWKEFAFLHGDRDFEDIWENGIKYWVMGHAHPSISLEDKYGVRKEKYKCFLIGKFKKREIVLVPSFFPIVEGADVKGQNGKDLGLAWDFNLSSFEVKIIEGEDSLKVLDFGKLRNF